MLGVGISEAVKSKIEWELCNWLNTHLDTRKETL